MNNVTPSSIAMLALSTLKAPIDRPKNVLLGKLMHRFPTDKSIDAYCRDNGLKYPSIGPTGAVFVEKMDAHEGPYAEQIGWIS